MRTLPKAEAKGPPTPCLALCEHRSRADKRKSVMGDCRLADPVSWSKLDASPPID